jgi:putative peptidoglycan lipid II flippase
LAELALAPLVTKPQASRRGRAVGVVSVLTVFVAGFGYLREAALAARFGLSPAMDAYFGAVFIPTMIYGVLIGGTLSPVFIPILLRADEAEGRAQLSETFSVVTNFALLFLGAIVCCAMLTTRLWLALLFPGFSPHTAAVTARLVYMIFPSLLFLAMAGILSSALNGFHKFAAAAFVPIVSSVTIIAAALLAHGDRAIYMVGIATGVGFVLQCLLLIPAIASLGIRYRLTFNFRHPAIRQLLRVGGPLFAYLAVANACLFLEKNLASHFSAGAVSTLAYAMKMFVLPANFLAAPLAIVFYTDFAREAGREGHGDLRNQVSRMLRVVVFVFLPITVWTVLNALPLTRLMYERGQFRVADSFATAGALSLYSIGILPNAIAVILLRCFYAVQDTVTPLLAEVIDVVFYAIVATVLTKHFGIRGLALTRGLSFSVVTVVLILVLSRKRKLLTINRELVSFALKTGLASVVMAIASVAAFHLLQPFFDAGKSPLRLVIVSIVFVISAAAFLGVARLLKLSEVADILKGLRAMVSRGEGDVLENVVELPSVNGVSP